MRLEPTHYSLGPWEFRPNICTVVGDKIYGHVHNHEHLTLCWRGRFLVNRWDANGQPMEERVIASCSLGGGVLDSRMMILAGEKHEFTVLDLEGGIAMLDCIWPEGIK